MKRGSVAGGGVGGSGFGQQFAHRIGGVPGQLIRQHKPVADAFWQSNIAHNVYYVKFQMAGDGSPQL